MSDGSDGVVMAEPTASKTINSGLLIYVFVPQIDQLGIQIPDSNLAWSVLDQIIHMPSHTGHDLAISQPTEFEWGHYDAAYYLLTTGDGVRAVVLALAIPGQHKIVVCNVSSPTTQASRIREMLPQLFDGLQIDGQTLPGGPLDALPDPLPFPRYTLSSVPDHQVNASGG